LPLILGIRLSFKGSGLWARRYALLALVILLVVFSVGGVFIAKEENLPWTVHRLLNVSIEPNRSLGVRVDLWEMAWEVWRAKPVIGGGLGILAALRGTPDVRCYPHNLVLELLSELGLLGAFLFGMLVIVAVKALGPVDVLGRDPWRMLVAMLFANAMLNALVSGDIPDNRFLFAVLGLMTFRKGELGEAKKEVETRANSDRRGSAASIHQSGDHLANSASDPPGGGSADPHGPAL